MSDEHSTTQHDFPPGTSLLYKGELGHGHEEGLTLVPRPSRDPNQPLNWSKARKAINFTFTLALTITIFTILSMQLVFWQLLIVDFNADYTVLNQTLSTNGAGCAIGCFIFIPLALKYGRRPVYIASTALLFAMMVWSSRMTTVNELFATNFFSGLGGAVNEALVGMTIADLFFVHQRGTMNALYLTMVMSGSFLTPVAAGVQATDQGWRWCYYLLSIFTGLLLLCFVFFYEETKIIPKIDAVVISTTESPAPEDTHTKDTDKSIDIKRVLSQDPTTGRVVAASQPYTERIDSSIPRRTWRQRLEFVTYTPEPLATVAIRPLRVLWYPHVLFAALQYAAGLSWLTVLASVVSIVFSQAPYNFSPAAIGYMGLGPFIGNIFGSIYSGPINDRAIRWFAKRNHGVFEPEMRLKMLHLPSLLMALGLIMFGITTAKGMHWIYPSIGGALFSFGLGAFGDVVLTLVIDSYREITGEAFTAIAFMRNAFSIWVPFIITPWMEGMGLQNMFIVMGVVSFLVSLLYIPMMWFGKKSRRHFAASYAEMSALRG